MTAFFAIAVLLVCAVLLCLLPPLLRRDAAGIRRGHGQANLLVLRDQARELDADLAAGVISASNHGLARAELAVRVQQDATAGASALRQAPQRRSALALGLGVPLFAAALYLYVGNPAAVTVMPRASPAPRHDSPASIDSMVAALAQRLQANPDDIEGLQMLARSYSALERHQEAARTYARLASLLPNQAGVLADYADALGTAQGATLKGEPERLVARALALEPQHVKALSLAGSAAFERGDFALAQRRWQAVLAQIPADSAFAQSTSASIAAAARAGGSVPKAPAPARALAGTVRLSASLRATVAPTDTVFIYARAEGGKGAPLAAVRRQARDLPLQFTLDDSMAIGAAAPLSQHARVMVGARISRSGSATPAAGDLEGSAGPLASDARNVIVEIATRRP